MTFISRVCVLLSTAFIILTAINEVFAFYDGPITLDTIALERGYFAGELIVLKKNGFDTNKIVGIGNISSCGQERFTIVALGDHKDSGNIGNLLQYLVVDKGKVKIIGFFEDYFTKSHDQICGLFVNEQIDLYRDGVKYTLYRVGFLNYFYVDRAKR